MTTPCCRPIFQLKGKNNKNNSMIKLYISVCFCLLGIIAAAQTAKYQCWPGGIAGVPGQAGYGNYVIRFDEDGRSVALDSLRMNFESTVAMAVDSSGALIFYSNGCYIANSQGDTISLEGGLNPGALHDWVCPTSGYIAPFGMSILQYPGDDPYLYSVIHLGADYSPQGGLRYGPLYLTFVDAIGNNLTGAVINQNVVALDQNNLLPFSIVRNGNGRDWYILVPEYGTNKYHLFIQHPFGIFPVSTQEIGPVVTCRHAGAGAFSPRGDKYARQQDCGILIYDFDRCSGQLANPQFMPMPPNAFGGGGLLFSPDGKKVITNTQMAVMSINLEQNPLVLDTIVSFYDVLGTSLGWMQYGPDGNIYISTMGRNNALHVLHPPDAQGNDWTFDFKGLPLPAQNVRTLPNVPDFTLFDWQGSPCDTLGITVGNTPDIPFKGGIRVFPNPASQLVTLEWENDFDQVQVFDVLGRMVDHLSLKNAPSKTVLPTGHLKNGVYFLVFSSGRQQPETRRLIIRR
jgi:hypothetical protein